MGTNMEALKMKIDAKLETVMEAINMKIDAKLETVNLKIDYVGKGLARVEKIWKPNSQKPKRKRNPSKPNCTNSGNN
jgi:hypothetical protein